MFEPATFEGQSRTFPLRMRQFSYDYSYCQTSNISRTLISNKIVGHSDVVGASPVGAAPTTSSFSTSNLASMDWAKTIEKCDEKHLSFWDLVRLVLRVWQKLNPFY